MSRKVRKFAETTVWQSDGRRGAELRVRARCGGGRSLCQRLRQDRAVGGKKGTWGQLLSRMPASWLEPPRVQWYHLAGQVDRPGGARLKGDLRSVLS